MPLVSKENRVDKNKRSTLLVIGGLVAGYVVLRNASSLIPQKLELVSMNKPVGFRKFIAGETSSGSFDPFTGIAPRTAQVARVASDRADDRVAENVCGALYAGLSLTPEQVPLASFSDYYCPFCRVQTKRLAKFAKSNDEKVAVAWHELPLLGENSNIAAKAALAAKKQGAYVEFHDRLMRTPFVASPEYLSQLSKDLGVDEDRLLADMASDDVAEELENSAALSRAFAFVGTPALVIGRTVVQGQVSNRLIGKIITLEREEGWADKCGYV